MRKNCHYRDWDNIGELWESKHPLKNMIVQALSRTNLTFFLVTSWLIFLKGSLTKEILNKFQKTHVAVLWRAPALPPPLLLPLESEGEEHHEEEHSEEHKHEGGHTHHQQVQVRLKYNFRSVLWFHIIIMYVCGLPFNILLHLIFPLEPVITLSR